jgi:hypothetical protein
MPQIPVVALMIPIVAIICVFTFVSIAAWADARRKEREAYYKSEIFKRVAETQGAGGSAALEYLREEDRITTRRAREGQKLGGLISMAVGAGLMLFLWGVTGRDDKGVYLVGAIPFFAGIALSAYAYLLAPKE